MELDPDKLLALYPGFTSVLGPYTRKDGRQHIVLNNSTLPKNTRGKTKTVSYPKALMECYLGRRLESDETVDHIDDNIMNNAQSNLQVLSRADNASKGHVTGASSSKSIVEYSRSAEGRAASSERMTEYNRKYK